MIQKNLKMIFWGYLALIVIPSIFRPEISGYLISLQFIGYFIILVGLRELASENEYLSKAYKLLYVLIALSIIPISDTAMNLEVNQGMLTRIIEFLIGIVDMIVNLMFTYNLLIGIGDISHEMGFVNLYEKANKYWGYYWKLLIASFAIIIVVYIPVISIFYVFVVSVLTIFLQLSMIRFFWQASNKLKKDISIE